MSAQSAPFGSETPVCELSSPELLLLTTARLFALGPQADPRLDWQAGFRAAGIASKAVPAFHTLFSIICIAQRRSLDVRHLTCPKLGFDESRLFQLLVAAQQKQLRPLQEILLDWLHPSAMRMAFEPLQQLAEAFLSADLAMPDRRHEGPHFPTNPRDPGAYLLH